MSRSLSRTSQLSVAAAMAMEPSDSRPGGFRRCKTSSLSTHALPPLSRGSAAGSGVAGSREGSVCLALTPRTPKDAFASSRSPPSTTRLPSMSRAVMPVIPTASDGLGRGARSNRRPKTWGNMSPSLSKAGTILIDEGPSSFGSPRTDSFCPSEPASPSLALTETPILSQTLRRSQDEAAGAGGESRPGSQANPTISKLLARRLKAAHLDKTDTIAGLVNFEKTDIVDLDNVDHVDSNGQATSSTSCGGHLSVADTFDFLTDFDGMRSPSSSAPLSSCFSPPAPKREIEVLPEGDKIFDRFVWDHVLQEDGDGGKVVLCQRRADVQQLSKEEAPRFVLKMRSKSSLAAQSGEGTGQGQALCHSPSHFGQQGPSLHQTLARAQTLGQGQLGEGEEEEEQPESEEVARFREVQLRVFNMAIHPGVGYYHEFLEDQRFFYILQQYGDGGALIQGLLETYTDGVIPESALRDVFREILQAVGHIHAQGMLHRDIKPDNLVMYSGDSSSSEASKKRIMLIDFDYAEPIAHSRREMDAQNENQFCGTPRFSAPECFLGKYSRASDLYSVGATLYLLVTGTMPFPDEVFGGLLGPGPQPSLRSVYERMRDRRVDWSSPAWEAQPRCRHFCQELMAFNPLRRPTSAELALQHTWLTEPSEPGPQSRPETPEAPALGLDLEN